MDLASSAQGGDFSFISLVQTHMNTKYLTRVSSSSIAVYNNSHLGLNHLPYSSLFSNHSHLGLLCVIVFCYYRLSADFNTMDHLVLTIDQSVGHLAIYG